MTNELDTLRPEVREAIAHIDAAIDGYGPGDECTVRVDDYMTIRAELLRLADDCARLVDCINAQPPTRRSLIDRAERAEAELAALKAKIAQAPFVSVRVDDGKHVSLGARSHAQDFARMHGKTGRLVVEE